MMKAREIREMSNDELIKQIDSYKRELFSLRFQQATGELANNAQIREIRKTIARIKTVINERSA